MCGIAGAVGQGGQDVRAEVAMMVDALRHRGPDDGGVVVLEAPRDCHVGLGARRLAVQDVSVNGRQPMTSARTGSVMVFNGELYNVDELRSSLVRRGHRFQGTSDTEAALAAFDEWGPEAVQRFRGMFAFAVWEPAAARLNLVRDRLGIKPLYFHVRGRLIAFASETRALLAGGRCPGRIDSAGLASFLALGGVREPSSILAEVRALGAGESAVWENGALTVRPYWSLSEAYEAAPLKLSREEVLEQLNGLLRETLLRHLVADVPLGVFLSGGIDSSALVALLSEATPAPLTTVSLVFPETTFSEQPYIDSVVERFGTEHRPVELSGADLISALPTALDAMDQPTVDGLNTWIVSRVARESGLTVALSGLGGDELFAGYSSFTRVPWLNTTRSVLPGSVLRASAELLTRAPVGGNRTAKVVDWLASKDSGRASYTMVRALFTDRAREALMGESQSPPTPPPMPRGSDPVNTVSCLELSDYTRNVLLRDADVMSMAHSLELRVPYLDHTLVEWLAQIPGHLKQVRGEPKPLLVDSIGPLLPRTIVDRPKMGFTLPFESWMRGPLREDVEARLLDPGFGGAVGDALDGDAVSEVWRDFLERRTSWSRPWALFALKVWGSSLAARTAAPVST